MAHKKAAVASLFLAAAAVGIIFGPTFGSSQEGADLRESVSVNASATIEIPPELARISLSVRADAQTASQAADELSARTNAVFDAMLDNGFTEEDLTIGDVNVFADRDRDRNLLGYIGHARVVVETEDIDRIGEIIDIGTDAGADGVGGVSFDLKDNSEAIKEALRRAMRFATAKAQVLAEESGRQLGRALTISEGGSTEPRPQAIGDALLGTRVSSGGGTSGGFEPAFPIIPPDIKVRARIYVQFALQ